MSLADKLATPPTTPSQTKLDKWLNALPTVDRDAVEAAILNTDWRHTDLQAALIAEGAPKVADTTFGVWRRSKGWKP